ncbi:hypothetical protein Ddye_022707 [Dipteronia dyeriana]|uniref:Protein FAR1-RELATED SEQUENCE n=1 Tax=Dipteronia dyeriana TaxID=168575 RepID=A0AAD9TRK2_9ROSI|nr:hypothetical protein Ddye_022707 [Dipteronia dyeriana]
MGREVGGLENFGFLDKDYRNYIYKKRSLNMEKGDAGAILQYFQKMLVENSSNFYSMQLDEDDMITNIFWADARSVSDYSLFGDVICFDTTYRTNEYGRPFAPFLRVNHHKQTVVFGAALLYDESADSFIWLFQTFLEAMSGKQPRTILTDQSAAMAKAISEVFPETNHRLCVWHIYQNAAKNLSHVFHISKQFAYDFGKCVYDHEDEEKCLMAWNDMLQKYNLTSNTWLGDLFEARKKWALVYGRHIFTADMMSTQRSESTNNVLKKYLMLSHNLMRFFEPYERVLEDRRYEELIADFKMMQTSPMLVTNAEMLQDVVDIYTPKVFKLFQKEYIGILNCYIYELVKFGMTYEYKVTYSGISQEHLVKYDVLEYKNIKRIPPHYILNRWTRDAKGRSITNYHRGQPNDNPKESVGKRYGHLCRNFREISSFAAEHEELTTYAHECSVKLLKRLEEMKKNLCLDSTCVNKSSHG